MENKEKGWHKMNENWYYKHKLRAQAYRTENGKWKVSFDGREQPIQADTLKTT